MKKQIFFLLFPFLLFAQSKRFYYELDFKLDSLNIKKDLMVLEINPDGNIFLSNDYIVTDSINTIFKDKTEFAYPKFTPILEFNTENNEFTFINNLSMNYYVFTQKVENKWKILEETKKIGAFTVQKATLNYGGRNWTAWFTPEIYIPFGPYVFNGLPGLIIEISDDKQDYKFSFVQNKNYPETLKSNKFVEKLIQRDKINIDKKDWKKVQMNFYLNPIAEYKSGDAMIRKDDGSAYTAEDYRKLERGLQNQIKRLNNPIELSEKVEYK